MKENIVRSHVTELRGHADLGVKPKSLQPLRREVSRGREQTGESPVLNHVNELRRQATLKGEQAPFQPNPAEQQAAARLGKPPPEDLEELDFDFPPEVYPSATYVNPLELDKLDKRDKRDKSNEKR